MCINQERKPVEPIPVPSPQAAVMRANVRFYREIAAKYDEYETCASDPRLQKLLSDDLNQIAGKLAKIEGQVSCLDCCGGSGNVALKMMEKGWSVTVVDISPDMLALLEAKARARGFSPALVCDSIEDFLSGSNAKYDVVSFSSALHHLYSPPLVVAKAAKRVRPGGFFYSNFDPVKPVRPRLSDMFLTFDTILAKALYDPKDFLPGIVRRARKLIISRDVLTNRIIASSGDLAEFHAKEGLDFEQIAEVLRNESFSVKVGFYSSGRTKIAQWVNQKLKASLSFKILAQSQVPNLVGKCENE